MAAVDGGGPTLCGWLWKLGAKGLVKTSKWRYFVFDEFTGHLNYFKTEDSTVPPLGSVLLLCLPPISPGYLPPITVAGFESK